jgi:hypothetical protein
MALCTKSSGTVVDVGRSLARSKNVGFGSGALRFGSGHGVSVRSQGRWSVSQRRGYGAVLGCAWCSTIACMLASERDARSGRPGHGPA